MPPDLARAFIVLLLFTAPIPGAPDYLLHLGPAPLALLMQITSQLSPQVVHGRLTGTVHNPAFHYEPVRLLTEEAIRYFLGRILRPTP